MNKICSTCKKELLLSAFNKCSRKPDGLRPECRNCQKAVSKKYYENGGREKKRRYYVEHRDEIIAKMRGKPGGTTKYNPKKSPARIAVHRAVKSGKLNRSCICEKCGIDCKTEAHHLNGYNQEHRLDVVWLCRNCHNLADHPELAKEIENVS